MLVASGTVTDDDTAVVSLQREEAGVVCGRIHDYIVAPSLLRILYWSFETLASFSKSLAQHGTFFEKRFGSFIDCTLYWKSKYFFSVLATLC